MAASCCTIITPGLALGIWTHAQPHTPAPQALANHRIVDPTHLRGFRVAMLSVAAAADLPRKEPPPVAAAPIGKYPVGKYPVGKYPVGKYPQPVMTKG